MYIYIYIQKVVFVLPVIERVIVAEVGLIRVAACCMFGSPYTSPDASSASAKNICIYIYMYI